MGNNLLTVIFYRIERHSFLLLLCVMPIIMVKKCEGLESATLIVMEILINL